MNSWTISLFDFTGPEAESKVNNLEAATRQDKYALTYIRGHVVIVRHGKVECAVG